MNYRQVTSIYFSPTERTKGVVEEIAEQFPVSCQSLDLTDAVKNRPDYWFREDEAVIVGVPVYGGRVPDIAQKRFRNLHGHGTAAVLVVTYGNRAYEDALLELSDILKEQGFRPFAAAAAVAEHNIVGVYAEGRPDEKDKKLIRRFGEKAAKQLADIKSSYETEELKLPGNRPYKAYGTLPIPIKVESSCTDCGLCVKKCPMQVISRTDPRVVDTTGCIACMRCIHVCPSGSRKVSSLMKLAIRQKLKKACSGRKEPEFFYEAGK